MSDITLDWSFGGQLRRCRVSREITLRAFSSMVGMDVGNLSKLERSERPPPQRGSEISKMVRVLKLNHSEESLLHSAAFNYHIEKLHERFWNE